MRHIITFILISVLLFILALYFISLMNSRVFSTISEIKFRDTEYNLLIVATTTDSVICVYDKKQIDGEVDFSFSSESAPYQHVIKDSLTIKIPRRKRSSAQWNNVYFVNQSGSVNAISYDSIFPRNDIKILNSLHITKQTLQIKDRILEYLEENPEIVKSNNQ